MSEELERVVWLLEEAQSTLEGAAHKAATIGLDHVAGEAHRAVSIIESAIFEAERATPVPNGNHQ